MEKRGRANDLGSLLESVMDGDEELNGGEILSVKISVISPFDAIVGGLLETASTEGSFVEVKIHPDDRMNQQNERLKWNYTIPSGEMRSLRYLYRVAEQAGPHRLTSKVSLKSEYGLKHTEQLDLDFEVKHSLEDLQNMVMDDFQELIQEEMDNQRLNQLGVLFNRFNREMARPIANKDDLDFRVDVILSIVDVLKNMGLEDDPMHYDLAELLITIEGGGVPPRRRALRMADDAEN